MKHARALVSIEYSIAATQWQKATQYTATQTNQPTNQATQLIVLHCGAMENVDVALCLCVEFFFLYKCTISHCFFAFCNLLGQISVQYPTVLLHRVAKVHCNTTRPHRIVALSVAKSSGDLSIELQPTPARCPCELYTGWAGGGKMFVQLHDHAIQCNAISCNGVHQLQCTLRCNFAKKSLVESEIGRCIGRRTEG